MDRLTDEFSLGKRKLAKDIIGEIVLAENPDKVIKKWRNIFKISQKALSNELEITPSVISDYESGRRKSPGIKMVGKYIAALLALDERTGGGVIRSFSKTNNNQSIISNAIIDIKEFSSAIGAQNFCRKINAVPIVKNGMDKPIYGYTIIDSHKAITELPFNEIRSRRSITDPSGHRRRNIISDHCFM